jgi:hypothetical protein
MTAFQNNVIRQPVDCSTSESYMHIFHFCNQVTSCVVLTVCEMTCIKGFNLKITMIRCTFFFYKKLKNQLEMIKTLKTDRICVL